MSYKIVSYKSNWSEEFLETGKTLRHFLENLALRIDHIGSTAVTGLAAKDIIDIQITVQSLAPAVEEAMLRAGYQRIEHIAQDQIPPGHLPDVAEWTKWFFKPFSPEQTTNVHVRLQGRANRRQPGASAGP